MQINIIKTCVLTLFAQNLAVNWRVVQKKIDIFVRFYPYKNVVNFTNDVIIVSSKIAELYRCPYMFRYFTPIFLIITLYYVWWAFPLPILFNIYITQVDNAKALSGSLSNARSRVLPHFAEYTLYLAYCLGCPKPPGWSDGRQRLKAFHK